MCVCACVLLLLCVYLYAGRMGWQEATEEEEPATEEQEPRVKEKVCLRTCKVWARIATAATCMCPLALERVLVQVYEALSY